MDDPEIAWLNTQVQAARQGSDEAFALLVEKYQRPVYNLCYRMLGDANEAEDASQECFWRAYQSLKKYDLQRPFATWLLSISAHFCIDQLRKRRIVVLPMEILPEEAAPDYSPGPEASFSQHEERAAVQALLSDLNPQDRAVIIMRFWYDLSYEEIAEALSLSVSAVKSRLHRSRIELAQLWRSKQNIPANAARRQYESSAL